MSIIARAMKSCPGLGSLYRTLFAHTTLLAVQSNSFMAGEKAFLASSQAFHWLLPASLSPFLFSQLNNISLARERKILSNRSFLYKPRLLCQASSSPCQLSACCFASNKHQHTTRPKKAAKSGESSLYGKGKPLRERERAEAVSIRREKRGSKL